MKYLPSAIVGISVLLFAPSAHACSCAVSNRGFVGLAEQSEVVVRGKVIAYQWGKDDKQDGSIPPAMTVEVNEVYKGTMSRSKVTVWGDNGMQCRPYVNQFPVGTEWVFALSSDPGSSKGELAVSICGDHWLPVNSKSVKGNVDGRSKSKSQIIGLPALRKLLKNSP
jgi:hypothetical protein